MDIFSPSGLKEMIMAQLRPGMVLSFPLRFHEVDTSKPAMIFENAVVAVESVPLKHGIPTVGYIFRERPRPLNIRLEKITELQLAIPQTKAAKAGENIILNDGRVIENGLLALPPHPSRSYAFLTDTLCSDHVLPFIQGVDML